MYRTLYLLLLIGSVVGMLFALYLQHVQHLDPCPLCIFQRLGLIGLGVFSALALLVPQKIKALRALVSLLATGAIAWSVAIASRHVWLQHLPADKVPECGPGLDFWLEAFPLKDVVQKVLHGSGECAKVDWTFLGLSLPHWSLFYFVVLCVISLLGFSALKR